MGKPTSNVSLTPELVEFVNEQVGTGNFSSSSEVHRAALSSMKKFEEERQARLARLRSEIQLGIDDIEAGRLARMNSPEELEIFLSECSEEATKRVRTRGVKISP